MKCHRSPRSAHSAALASASWWRFSPTSVTPRPASRRTSEAGKNLVTTTSVTSLGVASGRGARVGDATAHDVEVAGDLLAALLVGGRGHGWLQTTPANRVAAAPSRR